MARYVVLSFEDNEQAEAFVKDTIEEGNQVFIDERKYPDSDLTYFKVEVEGLFAKPTLFCPNSNVGGCPSGNRLHTFTRGKKFGWWVCAMCKKPVKIRHQKLMHQVLSQAKNLLEDLLAPVEGVEEVASVWDAGWGVAGRSSSYRHDMVPGSGDNGLELQGESSTAGITPDQPDSQGADHLPTTSDQGALPQDPRSTDHAGEDPRPELQPDHGSGGV